MTVQTDRYIVGFSDSQSLLTPANNQFTFFQMLKNMSSDPEPRVIYIGAAKGDDPIRVDLFKRVCRDNDCVPIIFSVYNMATDQADDYFRAADIIYIDGGVTRNLLALLKEWHAIEALRKAYERGVIISGASAGINLFFEWCITDSVKTKLRPCAGLGILQGSFCPHFDARSDRPAVFEVALSEQTMSRPAYGLDEGVCTVFKNETLEGVYSLSEKANLHLYVNSGNWKALPKIVL